MKNIFISEGKFTLFGVAFFVVSGFFVVYLSVEFIPWRLGKFLGLCLGLAIAAVGGFSGRAHALDLPPPFTKDPLGWRKAKESYKSPEGTEESVKKDTQP
jgi:hypothetical protein